MTRNTSKTTISNDGLRFVSRSNGTPFTSSGSHAPPGATMSCFLCGRHRPRTEGRWRKLLGKHHFVCNECDKPSAAVSGSASEAAGAG